MAFIGVRSMLGLDNPRGLPFNAQRSIYIPNLTFDEVAEMYHWYERESGQAIEPAVIERIYSQLCGQPGLTEPVTVTTVQSQLLPHVVSILLNVRASCIIG